MTFRIARRKRSTLIRAAAARAVVFLYAFFLLTPHFGSVTHVHERGGAAHDHVHATASRHDVALERAALTLVPDVLPEGAPHLELGTPAPDARRSVKATRGDAARASLSDRDARAHTHAAHDPNLIALGAPAFAAADLAPHALAPDAVPGFVPALAALAAPARAPPARV